MLSTVNKYLYFLLSTLNKIPINLLFILNKFVYLLHILISSMDSLFLKQERMLALTSTNIIRELMNQIHWNNRLIAIRGSRGEEKQL